ncbi:NADH-ubiquinone oxidoreductase chain 3 (mitochondrion) [[Candida] jaroonii]|uniref:NADH-ubiquinone oxidoreductase chain 3 n=1 Tax=[Candida] jaroonii TaxID=467808 RepID=A0ACA9YGI2_9ASCO|nr:NADH-ubiquinone oxidoreductase chain 3 [[Candida] jaroonii]
MFTFFFYLAPMVAVVLMLMNYLMSNENPYVEKNGPFECGFTSYHQSRSAFNVSFMLMAMLFLPFDLEMSSMLPYVMSAYTNGLYGLMMLIMFLLQLVMAFVYEMNLGALNLTRNYTPMIKPLKHYLYKK